MRVLYWKTGMRAAAAAARTVLAINIAIVSGPTPPGTGVSSFAFGNTRPAFLEEMSLRYADAQPAERTRGRCVEKFRQRRDS